MASSSSISKTKKEKEITMTTAQTETQENGSASPTTSSSSSRTAPTRSFPKYVPYNAIVVNTPFNIRTMYPEAEIRELADSIQEDGQETPLKVRYDEDGQIHLVSGFRRSMAFKLLKWGSKDVEVSFRADPKDKKTKSGANVGERMLGAFMSNLRENLNRSDVTYHDLAKRYWELEQGIHVDDAGNVVAAPSAEAPEEVSADDDGKDESKNKTKKNKKGDRGDAVSASPIAHLVKTDRKSIAATTGHSISHIGNLIRAWKNLSDDSKKVWQRGFTAAGKRHDLPLDIVFMLAKGDDGEPLNDERQADVLSRYIEAIEKQGGKRTRTKKSKKDDDSDSDGNTPATKAELGECLGKLYEVESEGGLSKVEEAFLKGKIHMARIAVGDIGPQNVLRKLG